MEARIKDQVVNHIRSVVKRNLPRSIVEYITKARYVKEVRGHYIPEFNLIRHLINPGEAVIDLGANFGWYTKFLSEAVRKEGKVFSVEPIPLNFKVLEHIIHSLHLDNVHTFRYAISDHDGLQTMAVPLSDNGEENLYEAKVVENALVQNAHTISVETRTLDSLFVDVSLNISFIKCDVEGHELQCLKGGRKLIEKFHPAWQIEIWGDPDDVQSSAYETFHLLTEAGYLPFMFNGQNLNKRKKGERQTDYFFLMPSHINAVRNRSTIQILTE
jgi:FkbM family methyltransferase